MPKAPKKISVSLQKICGYRWTATVVWPIQGFWNLDERMVVGR
jgi:hypothetical protein